MSTSARLVWTPGSQIRPRSCRRCLHPATDGAADWNKLEARMPPTSGHRKVIRTKDTTTHLGEGGVPFASFTQRSHFGPRCVILFFTFSHGEFSSELSSSYYRSRSAQSFAPMWEAERAKQLDGKWVAVEGRLGTVAFTKEQLAKTHFAANYIQIEPFGSVTIHMFPIGASVGVSVQPGVRSRTAEKLGRREGSPLCPRYIQTREEVITFSRAHEPTDTAAIHRDLQV